MATWWNGGEYAPGSLCPKFCRFMMDKSIELEKVDESQTHLTEVIYNLV